MSKKELLAKILYRTGLLRTAVSLSTNSVTILTYHRIRPDPPTISDGEPFDNDVYGPSQSEFERQVKWLKENFDVVPENDLLDLLSGRRAYRNHYVAITFDDGYRDNYTLAYPVLRAHSAPAIFFVCPGLIDSRRVAWWDLIAYFIKKSQRSNITIHGQTLPLGQRKKAAMQELTGWMKTRPARETANLMSELAVACEVEFPAPELQDAQFMTWEQVLELDPNVVAIGSHTYTHRVLATLDEESQLWELSESKAALEQRLGRPIRNLAYPVGGYEHFTVRTMQIAAQAGYECAFSFQTGYNLPGAYPFNIRRITTSDKFGAMFACGTAFPAVFSWLRPMPASHQVVAEGIRS